MGDRGAADPHLGSRADARGRLFGRLEPHTPFQPQLAPARQFHDAQSILLCSLSGASGLYFLRGGRRGKEDPERDLALGALLPSLFWIAQRASFAFPEAKGFEAGFPVKVLRLKGVWVNERYASILMLVMITLRYVAEHFGRA